jgi:hypothetical protein
MLSKMEINMHSVLKEHICNMLIGVSNTYFRYGMTASQLYSTYLCACSFSRSVRIKLDGLPNGFL